VVESNKPKDEAKKEKLSYSKPTIKSEPLTTVAALCNGTTSGGRKATTGAPNFCNAGKLKS